MKTQPRDADTPPAYGVIDASHLDGSTTGQFHADFSSLDLDKSQSVSFPTTDLCLAYLKLLCAFEALKSKVGYSDGLWGIWDSRGTNSPDTAFNAEHRAGLAFKQREKRWAIYVARAVDRYEAWWKSFAPEMLAEADILVKGAHNATKHEGFTNSDDAIEWSEEMIPPIGECFIAAPVAGTVITIFN